MMKIFLYSLAVLASVILASCNGDYDDWAQPQHNPQEEAITIPGFTATPVAQSIDCSSVTTDSVSIFTLSEAALPEGFTLDNARLEIIPQGEDNASKKNVNASIEGKSAVADLSEVTASFYGKRPIAHSFVAHVYLNAVKNGDAVLIDAGKFNLEMTPKAPFIDSGYYLVGDMFKAEGVDGWNTVSEKQAFMHSDKDVYDDPIFTITFETKEADQYWKIIPKKNIDAETFWAAGVVGPKIDGDVSMTGLLTSDGPGAGKIAEPGKYRLTLNMMDYSYTIEKVMYDPFIYFICSTDAWGSSDQKLALVDDEKGTYTGYIYLADPNNAGFEFKFQRVAGSWDNAIGASNFVTFKDAAIDANKGNNLGVNAGEGVYYMDVNLSEGTITATKVESMGMVGQFQGWDKEAPVPMTWNAEEYCFEATMAAGVTADGWKFIVNKDWPINLGGSIDNLEQDGANLTVTGNTIKLYPTRKTNDNIFCTVE